VPVETEMLCELWEEELLAPCTSSKLYCLEPIGVRTPMVESLTSYISRLAKAHSVLLRTLVTDEILPHLNRTHLYQEGQPVYDHLTTFWKRSAMLNGTCSTASHWVRTVEQLTQRNDLRFLTMLTFAHVLSWRGLVRSTQAWCPLCYNEWRMAGRVIYQPLIWQLSVIDNCPQHQIPLHLHCPFRDCRRPLPPLTPRSQSGYCTHCNRWLGMPLHSEAGRAISSYEQEWQIWVGKAVGELLAAVPSFPSIPSQVVFSMGISAHVNGAMEGNFSEFARRVQFHRRTVWEWAQGLQVPKLDALLHICSYFGTTPTDLLMGNFHEIVQIKKDIFGKKPITEQPHRQFRRFEAEKLRDALEQVLQSEEYPPPSMREVAQRLNYDQSHLRKHFPDLCEVISARYLAYQQRRRLDRLRKMNDQVQQAAEILQEQAGSLSERQVGKMIGKRGIFKEEEVRASLKNFLSASSHGFESSTNRPNDAEGV
jgi:transcriptional regulator with XRE-family HTH domain